MTGYLIAPLQSEAVATAIADTEKPVVAFDTNIESDKCLSFVGTGNKEAAKKGAIAAVEAAKAAGWEEIKCIEIAGVQGDATNTARMDGYREGITEAGGEFLDDEVQYANATARPCSYRNGSDHEQISGRHRNHLLEQR